MTQPTRTPNRATDSRPERSSKKVARKKPLGLLPWLLLGLLALLLAAVFLVINAVDDDGPDGPAGDTLGQRDSGGSGIDGQDGDGQVAGTKDDAAASSSPDATQPSAAPTDAAQPSAAPQAGGLAGLAAGALVGGGGVPAATDSAAGRSLIAPRPDGTAGTVLFAQGSAELDSESTKVIAQAARRLQEAGVRSVEVIGFTDEVAGEAVNDPLSQQRADSVAEALRSDLPDATVTTSALGAEQPVASNDDEAGRQQNRRAAIVAQR